MAAIVAGLIVAYLMHLYYKEKDKKEDLQRKIDRIENTTVSKSENLNAQSITTAQETTRKTNNEVKKITNFESLLENIKKSHPKLQINGPLSNGDYSILYEDTIKIIIFPNLKQSAGNTVMDLIIIPQNTNFDINQSIDITSNVKNRIPGKKYLYDIITIERSMSRTACIHIAFDQQIIYDDNLFLDSLEYFKGYTNSILRAFE